MPSARIVDGQYWPVSIELIVWRLTPTRRAKSPCERRCSARATRSRVASLSPARVVMAQA